MINSAAGSGRKGESLLGLVPSSRPPLQQPEHLQRLQGEEVPSDQLPPQCLFKITLSWSKQCSEVKNKTPLCFPLSSLPRQFHVGCCRGSQGWEVLLLPLAHASSCPS